MIAYSNGRYVAYKAEYPGNNLIIQDESIQQELRWISSINSEGKVSVIGDAFEVFAWYYGTPNNIAISDMGTVIYYPTRQKLQPILGNGNRLKVIFPNNAQILVDNMVALTFIPNADLRYKFMLKNIDGVPYHTWASNLYWEYLSGPILEAPLDFGTLIFTPLAKFAVIQLIALGKGTLEIADSLHLDVSDKEVYKRLTRKISKVRSGEDWYMINPFYTDTRIALRNNYSDLDDKIIEECLRMNPNTPYSVIGEKLNKQIDNRLSCHIRRIKHKLFG